MGCRVCIGCWLGLPFSVELFRGAAICILPLLRSAPAGALDAEHNTPWCRLYVQKTAYASLLVCIGSSCFSGFAGPLHLQEGLHFCRMTLASEQRASEHLVRPEEACVLEARISFRRVCFSSEQATFFLGRIAATLYSLSGPHHCGSRATQPQVLGCGVALVLCTLWSLTSPSTV